jgi:hypothetical protein
MTDTRFVELEVCTGWKYVGFEVFTVVGGYEEYHLLGCDAV